MYKLQINLTKSILLNIIKKKNHIEIYIYGPLGIICKRFYRKFDISFKSKRQKIVFNHKLQNKHLIKTYKTLLEISLNGLYLGCKKILEIRGIGYYINKISVIDIGFKLGSNLIINFLIPKSVKFTVNKKKLVIYGIDFQKLNQINFALKNLHKLDIYKGKGLFSKGQFLNLKEGKRIK
jgi:ribosomal protein L6P/L9E